MDYEKVILLGLKSLGGSATTKQLGQYMVENYSVLPFDANYRMRWAQQELKKKNLVVSSSKFSDKKWRLQE